MKKNIWLNHKLVSEKEAKVSVFDRGFLYGDGVYETVRVYDGKIFRSEEHWKRLDHSLKGVRIRNPWTRSYLNDACRSVIRASGLNECLLRITLTRGVGVVGYDPHTCKSPTLVLFAAPIRKDLPELWKNGVRIAFARVRRNHPNSLNPAFKVTNCLNGILAKMETLEKGAFEGIFLNLDGHVAEGTISNLFIIKNGVVKTPHLNCGILDGVTRSAVIEVAKDAKIPVRETHLDTKEVLSADEVFLTSTTMEVMPVVRVEKSKIGDGKPGNLSQILHAKFRDLLKKELRLP